MTLQMGLVQIYLFQPVATAVFYFSAGYHVLAAVLRRRESVVSSDVA
jgi:hypothetical protein